MLQITSELVGIVDLELDADELRVWLRADDPPPEPGDEFGADSLIDLAARQASDSSEAVIADLHQLTEDLEDELFRLSQRFLPRR